MSKRKFNRSSSWGCVEYWIAKGFTEPEAKLHISRKQQEINQKRKNNKHSEETKRKISESNKKLSSLEYWTNKFGKDGEKKFNEYKESLKLNGLKTSNILKSKNINRRTTTPRCKEFWINKGFSEQEATKKVSETQSTFSLNKCIEKHGEELGILIWNNRQEKWKKSLKQNNFEIIRAKQRDNAHIGFYTETNFGGENTLLFYLLLVDNSKDKVLKYGLTKHADVKDRWGVNRKDFKYEVLFSKRLESAKAVALETILRDKYKGKLVNSFRLTEIIDLDELNNVRSIINEHIGSTDVIF